MSRQKLGWGISFAPWSRTSFSCLEGRILLRRDQKCRSSPSPGDRSRSSRALSGCSLRSHNLEYLLQITWLILTVYLSWIEEYPASPFPFPPCLPFWRLRQVLPQDSWTTRTPRLVFRAERERFITCDMSMTCSFWFPFFDFLRFLLNYLRFRLN